MNSNGNKVSINIVAWNSLSFLPDLMKSIEAQTFRDFVVRIIDNGSNDGTEKFIRDNYPKVTYLRNVRNLGFAPAHNQGIKYTLDKWPRETWSERYVLVTNPDIILSEDYLEKIVKVADAQPAAGSFGGKLLKVFEENFQDEALREKVQSEIIDSTGMNLYKSRRVAERGAGEMDHGQYDNLMDIFGVSGALVLYRASALADVRYKDEYFDHDFFAYKEDVDMAWRLRLQGWSARYVPEATAYHYRGAYGAEKSGWLATLKNRLKKPKSINWYSTRNHPAVLIKNDFLINLIRHFPRIMFYEFKKLFYILLFEQRSLKGLGRAMTWGPRMLRKRSATMSKRKISAKEMRLWIK